MIATWTFGTGMGYGNAARAQSNCIVKLMRPNPPLNADVPHAGLRPCSGPPVSLFR
jgi:hypothetical protein